MGPGFARGLLITIYCMGSMAPDRARKGEPNYPMGVGKFTSPSGPEGPIVGFDRRMLSFPGSGRFDGLRRVLEFQWPGGGIRSAKHRQWGDLQGPYGQRATVPKSGRTGESALRPTRSKRQAVALVVDQCPGAAAGVGRRVRRGRRPAAAGAQATLRSTSHPAHSEWPKQQIIQKRIGSSVGGTSRTGPG